MRKIHFVGSLPPGVTDEGPLRAMEWALHTSGWYTGHADLTGVPCDLDTRWIIDYLDDLADRPAFRTLRGGDSSDYDSMPIYRKLTKGLRPDDVSMRREAKLKAVIDAYRELREQESRRPQSPASGPMPPLRISLPCPLDLALFVFCGRVDLKRHPIRTLRGSWLAFKHLGRFASAMVGEVAEVSRYAAAADIPVVWQLEAPSVLYAMNLVPRFLQGKVARVLAEIIARMLTRLWDYDLELHLCDGDLGHKAITHGTPAQMAEFLNRLGPLLDHYGVDRPPVHLPFACGDSPAPANFEYYTPLEALDRDWVIYAGVADEKDYRASRTALHYVETATGRVAAAVATACGLGRRSTAAAEDAIETCLTLATADRPEEAR